ncbi:Cytoplasmic tRNA 2-thiolation protein 1 [Vitis vinifera]|uniref:Cytoplasmic tRNA 2-thiolation protein 1 n=1 Tax=Vitis vinifera TaxID=29760 RepID=A0A438K4C5_VITVI|nr:Cytoplasmic tRNA 2-thiolation protein 1 [Vitis vinifera]
MGEAEVKPKKAGPVQCSICSQRRAALKRPKTLEQVPLRPSQFQLFRCLVVEKTEEKVKFAGSVFYAVFEEEIHRVVVDNQLFKPGERIAIGASGGKGEYLILCDFSSDNDVTAHEYLFLLITVSLTYADSTVLAYVLSELNRRHNYGLDLFLLSVDEGITGYRDDSLETVKRNEIQVHSFVMKNPSKCP